MGREWVAASRWRRLRSEAENGITANSLPIKMGGRAPYAQSPAVGSEAGHTCTHSAKSGSAAVRGDWQNEALLGRHPFTLMWHTHADGSRSTLAERGAPGAAPVHTNEAHTPGWIWIYLGRTRRSRGGSRSHCDRTIQS